MHCVRVKYNEARLHNQKLTYFQRRPQNSDMLVDSNKGFNIIGICVTPTRLVSAIIEYENVVK